METVSEDDRLLVVALETAMQNAWPLVARSADLRRRWMALPPEERGRLDSLTNSIAKEVSKHPLSVGGGRTVYLHNPFSVFQTAEFTADRLLELAMERTPAGAVQWYRKVSTANAADIRFVLEVYGLKIDEPLELSNGTTLRSLEELKATPRAAAILKTTRGSLYGSPIHGAQPPVTITIDKTDIEGVPIERRNANDNVEHEALEALKEALRGLTISHRLKPVAKSTWYYFTDPDLQRAESGWMWSGPLHETGLETVYPQVIENEDVDWANRYVALPSSMRAQLHVAIDRYGSAQRRHSIGDKAIDGAIALEALLGDPSQKSEMTHKVATRLALLLSEGDERVQMRAAIKKFYELRSTVVHGGTVKPQDRQIVEGGLAACGDVIRQLIKHGKPMDMARLDLGL